mmetsp:Transcript_11682/g.32218  ORF Transcript_11682/g.32218 Transcript_11682/m.32218 type:complete len:118 (+) Transcript_11682:279-632(+)
MQCFGLLYSTSSPMNAMLQPCIDLTPLQGIALHDRALRHVSYFSFHHRERVLPQTIIKNNFRHNYDILADNLTISPNYTCTDTNAPCMSYLCDDSTNLPLTSSRDALPILLLLFSCP